MLLMSNSVSVVAKEKFVKILTSSKILWSRLQVSKMALMGHGVFFQQKLFYFKFLPKYFWGSFVSSVQNSNKNSLWRLHSGWGSVIYYPSKEKWLRNSAQLEYGTRHKGIKFWKLKVLWFHIWFIISLWHFITKCDRYYYKMWQSFVTKCGSYYNMQRLLQNASVQL